MSLGSYDTGRITSLKQITWAKMHADVGLLAGWLASSPRLQRGERLGVFGRNSVEYLQVNTIAGVLKYCQALRLSSILVALQTDLAC